MALNKSIFSAYRISYILVSLLALFLILTPITVNFLNAEPGITAFYRRALTMSDSKKQHPMVTLVEKPDDQATQGLHSHDNNTANANGTSEELEAVHQEAVNNVMMAPPLPGPHDNLVDDIHDASAQIVKEWGFGWDTKIARVIQVLIGLSIYFAIMVVKGFIISWGIGQVKDQFQTAVHAAGNTDILANLVNSAVNNLATKFGN